MTYGGGAGPPGQAFNGGHQAPPRPAYPMYGDGQLGNPQYQHIQHQVGYVPYPQQPQHHAPPPRPLPPTTTTTPQQQHHLHQAQHHPQHVQYAINNMAPVAPYNGGFDHHASFAPAPYGQAPFAQPVAAAPMPTYQPVPMTQQTPPLPPLPPPPQQQQHQHQQQHMAPPPQRQPQMPVGPSSPVVAPNRRVSSDGAIRKPSQAPRKSSSSAVSSATTSPNVTPKCRLDSPSILVCVAEDCFSKAYAGVQGVAVSNDLDRIREYHQLIATGLACLEAAIHTNKLSPRAEALAKLRFGSILCEETENLMEAETALQSAVTLCDKHRIADLKLYIQYIFLKVLFRRNPKAALIALDSHISDCISFKQIYWVYAYRFLKASFHMQNGTDADAHALENLRSISTLAVERGDKAISVMASLLEGLTHLKMPREDSIQRIQGCIAQASKYQLDSSVNIPQLETLKVMLDLGCALTQKLAKFTTSKLSAMQSRMDEIKDSSNWKDTASELRLPLRKQSTSASTISSDTAAVLCPGDDEHDFLVLKCINKPETYAVAHCLSGVASLNKLQGTDRSFDFWREALKLLSVVQNMPSSTPVSLQEAMSQEQWRADVSSYLYVLIGLHSATHSDWARVKACLSKLQNRRKGPRDHDLSLLLLYLTGVYEQGVGNLDEALQVFRCSNFSIDRLSDTPGSERLVEAQLAVLSTLNRVLIMQDTRLRDEAQSTALLEQLERVCADHVNLEVRTAYNIVASLLATSPPLSVHQVKRLIHLGLRGAQTTCNTQFLSITLNIMRFTLFKNIVGDQAVKSAKAGSTQAKKSGNLLWMSVGEGMLASSYEKMGEMDEARAARDEGIRCANESWERTQDMTFRGDL